MLGKGIYVSRQFEKARRYPINSKINYVLQLIVNPGKVKIIDKQNHEL